MSGYTALTDKGLKLSFEEFKEVFQPAFRAQDAELAKTGLEINLQEFSRDIMPKLGLEPTDEMVDAYVWGRFRPHSVNNEMFDDVPPTLTELEPKCKIGLISNAQPHGILWWLDKSGIVKYFDEIIISGAVGLSKPNPRIFEVAAESICSEPEECMMVGDDPWGDAKASHAVGMTGVLIDRAGRLKQPIPDIKVAHDLREILRWVS
jgi:HAD superfamily hydrolase (TIGR01549 family)